MKKTLIKELHDDFILCAQKQQRQEMIGRYKHFNILTADKTLLSIEDMVHCSYNYKNIEHMDDLLKNSKLCRTILNLQISEGTLQKITITPNIEKELLRIIKDCSTYEKLDIYKGIRPLGSRILNCHIFSLLSIIGDNQTASNHLIHNLIHRLEKTELVDRYINKDYIDRILKKHINYQIKASNILQVVQNQEDFIVVDK